MKANFNIAKNVRNSHSINALSALRRLQSLGLLLCALMIGSLQVWGATDEKEYDGADLAEWDGTHSGQYAGDGSLKLDATGEYAIKTDIWSGTISSGMTGLTVVINAKINGTGSSSNKFTVYAVNSEGTTVASKYLTENWGGSYGDHTFTITGTLTNVTGLKLEYTTKSGGNVGIASVTATATYTAGPTLYTVTFDANGGSVTPASATQASAGAAVTLPTPTWSGYNCTGWFTATSGGTKRGDAGGSYTPTASETIHAQWSAKTYSNYRTLCSTTDPSLSVSPASLNELDYIVGAGPSAAKSFSMSGSNLESGTLTVTAPTNFQVSKASGSGWASSITFTGVSGTLAATTVYVRLATGKSAGEYSGNVSISGCGLESAVNVVLSGTVYTPTITASPASITGWNAITGSAPSPATKAVEVTGVHLKADISVSLTSGSDYFSIDKSSFAQTSGSASGTITISVKAAAYASAATRNGNIRLTSTDATTVDVPITLLVQDDPREKFELLTSSNLSQLSDGAKLVLVDVESEINLDTYEYEDVYYAMTETQDGSNGHTQTTTGFEMLSANTILAIAENNPQSVQVLELVETATPNIFALYTGSTKNTYLYNSGDKKLNEAANYTNDNAKWSISVDGDGYAIIDAQGGQSQQIGYNSGASGAKFRCYSSGYSIYAYFQPSVTPSISVSPSSLSGFTYVVGNGPSATQNITVSGLNLTGDLTVKAPSNYQVSTDGGSTWSTSGGTKTISASGTLSATTVKVRLVAGLIRGTYNDATGVKVYGGGVDEANAKTVSLAGNVTNAFHTVTISAGANGSVSPSGAQSVEEGQTLAVTATPNTGYEFSSWTVTGTGSSCTASASGTFTMGTANATLQANFSQIMVSSITVSGDATVKTLASKTYTASVLPSTALTKTVTWSVINGTGTATINSSTGVLTAGSPGTVTVRATANDGSGIYGELAVTVQNVVRYKFVKMTSTPDPWEDDDYLIVNESSNTILKASDPLGSSDPSTGVGATKSVTITSSTITLEDDKDDAVHISYVDTKGYLVQAVGGYRQYIVQNGTNTGGSSMKTLASDNSTNTRYWSSIAHNLLKYQSTYNIAYNTSSYRFYDNNYKNIVLYRLETTYTVTCNTPSNGTLTSDMGSAASGTTVTLTVTPSSGYELSALTITKDGGGTVTPTKVDETHYTFTMPKDNVTVEATFVTIQTKDIIFHTPSCVITPSTLSGKATGATVTLPSEPAGTPDGYTFLGWVLAEQISPVAVQPTTYAPGSYTVPSGAADINMYALYSEGGISVGSGTFNYIHEASSGLTTFTNLTSDDYYIFTSEGNNAAVVSNTISGTRVGYGSCTGAGESTATISTADGVYLLHKTGDYYTLKNVQTGQYLASTGIKSQATMMDDDGTNDHVKWSIVSTSKGYKLANKYNTDNDVNAYLGFSAGNGYGCYASSNTTITMFFYKAASGAVTINTTYTTSPDCFCEYSLLKSTNSGSTWEEVGCFTKVKPNDDSDHEWQLANFTMPALNSSTLLKVQREGYDYVGQTGSWQSGWIPLAELQGGSCTYKAFELEGAVGTLRIYDIEGGNSVDANSNFYLGFYPTYQITHGVDGGGAWANESFELVDAETHKYQTAVTTAPAGYFADNNYKFYIGARKSDGTTKYVSKNDGGAQDKSNTQKMNTMGGMTTDVGGRSGVYQIYSNSCDQNWYCSFIPYYVVYYHDVNGNEIEEWRDVLTSPTTTVHAYASGQTGWATSQGGAASATYNAGSVITPATDVHLYQVASTYTVTYSVASETSSIDGTSVKVIQGQSVTLPTITFSCPRYPTFVGWISGSAIPASDPEVKTEEPASFVGAGGDSYTPTGDVTLRALYGHNCDGNAGWQKQTTISAGRYLMVTDAGYAYAGQHSGSGSTVDYGDNISGVTISDGVITTQPLGSEAVTVSVNGSYFAIYVPSQNKYLAPDYSMTCGSSGGATSYLNATVTNLADAYFWRLSVADQADSYINKNGTTTNYTFNAGEAYTVVSANNCSGSGTIPTTVAIQANNSNHQFRVYTHTQTPVYFYKLIKTGYYTTNPTCEVPTEFTLSFNGNKPDAWEGDVENVPSNIVRTFSPFPTLATTIDLGSITNPTLTGWKLTGWNAAANGSGTPYALNATISEYTGNSLTLYAQWERVYSVTLYDNGVERTTLVEASAGAGVTLPSGNNCGVGSAFTFEGWTESAVELNADPVRPATLHAAGTYAPTSDITLYSVYSKSVVGCEDFAAGVSGAYKMYYDGSTYATTAGTSGSYTGATSGTAEVFYIAYAPAHTGYTIRTSTGFVGWNYDGSELTKANATPYYWKISGSSSNWVITPEPSLYTRQLKSTDGSKFQLYAAATSGKLLLQKSAMTYYYNTAICEENSITFHDGGGTISGTPTTPDGASWNSGTHVLSGLDDCDKITTFPTANYDGWTFVGWSTEDYSNSGKHTTDHPEENASTDEPDGSEIYKTGGNPYVVRGGSIDLYPIFTRFPDNEPFNTESGGDYYIYYLKPGTDDGYGANVRVYATAYDGEKRYGQTTSCAAATEFTFTKDGDIWHIYDKTTSKYVTGLSTQDWLLHADDLSGALDDWTITIKSGNQFNASCQGGGRFISFSTSANYFMDYSTTANPGICLPVYLGSCTERIFSSEPNPTPTIDLTGEPMVTSSVGQQIRATATMTLSAAHLGSVPANKIIVSGTNLKFATTASATPSNTLSLSLTDGSLAATTIYVYYTPTAGDTEDGLENIVVTAKAYYTTTPKDVQTTGIVHARHLPADFVIAAKASNGKWYALPADITSSKSLTDGVLIEVDNANDPTEATAAPNNTKWGLRNVKSGRQTGSGVGDNLVFTERLTTATPNDQKTLYNGSGTSIQVYAQYSGYDGSNPAKYEWVVTESNLKDYTLTSASESRTLSLGTNGKFGALTIAKEYEGKLRLLPAEFYEPAEMQVLEWKANSVVVMYTGTQTTATTKVGANAKSSAQTLASQKLTHGIYELTTSQSLVTNSGAKLEMVFGSDAEKMIVDIPIIINSTSTATDGHVAQDVVIVNGGKLTAATTQHNYRNVYVYGGGKLKIESGKSLGVNNIIMRAGGITTNGSGGSAAYDYVYPQVELGGTLESAADSIQYEYITDYDHWYQLCLPFDGTLSTIQYPQEYYGDNVTATNTGSWVIKRYAGEVRATGDYDAWKDIETEGATSVTAGHGYIFWGAPKKVTINGDKQRQQWGIQRITMPITAAAATSAETADKNISVDSYSEVATSDKPNDQGWNLVGNPYMVNLTNLSSESMIAGQLVHTETVPWDGKWRNNGDDVRYVTIPDNHFDSYVAKTASVASGEGDFMPGRAFFVQIAEGASTLTFAAANRASLMPARFAQTAQSVDIETGIVMSDETKHDEVNFWIKDGKTAEYEYNADYPKTPNNTNFNIYGVHSHGDLSWIAISPEIAEGSMAIGYQVPTAGEYRLSMSETYVSDKIDQLLVTDHEMSPEITTNLLTEDYVFQVNQAETNNTRFTVSIRLVPQTPTDIGNVPGEGLNADHAKPQKFIYHDKLYILRNGVIYDATGKQVKGGLK